MEERYDPSKKPVKTIGLDGDIYDSGLEARFAGTCNLLGIEYRHNEFAVMSDELAGGQYKPDFAVYEDDEGHVTLIEVKGYIDESSNQGRRSVAAFKVMKKLADDPKSKVTRFIKAWSRGIEVHEHGKDERGAFYTCADCGTSDILTSSNRKCRKCGSGNVTHVCVDFNEWFNIQWRKRWQPNVDKVDVELKRSVAAKMKAAANNRRLLRRIKQLAKQMASFDFSEGGLRVLDEFTAGGQYTPTGYYTEQKVNRSIFGSALAPLVIVEVNDSPTWADKEVHRKLETFVDDHENPIVKFVLANMGGFSVYELGTWGDGSVYTCSACGKSYIAKDTAHQCPCCGSEKTAKHEKKRKKDE